MEQCEAEFAQRKSGEGCSQADCVEGRWQGTGAAVGKERNARKRLKERMRGKNQSWKRYKGVEAKEKKEEREKTKGVKHTSASRGVNCGFVNVSYTLRTESGVTV